MGAGVPGAAGCEPRFYTSAPTGWRIKVSDETKGEGSLKVSNPITDYKLIQDEDGRVLTSIVVIENSLRIIIKKPELWNMITTLETIFNNMDIETEPVKPP